MRKSGILLPISSLPGRYGIGSFGEEAYRFADFLAASGQSAWQILPLGPTSYGDSPYSSFSSSAGNPYFIDLDKLIEEGLLDKDEVEGVDWGSEPEYIDYGKIYEHRFDVLRLACERGWAGDAGKIAAFVDSNRGWLPDYALFMALKRHFGMKSWIEWPDEDARMRKSDVIEKYRCELDADIRLFTWAQYKFFEQWDALREYVHSLGIEIIGDIPIYVALDSADVWSDPRSFLLDERNVPTVVAGVPPDYFCADGQLWGNPIYDWEHMKSDGYGWWIRRIESAKRLYDVIRIDHFRGFDSYWAVPYGEETAKNGEWRTGPGIGLVGVLRDWFHDTRFIAEDLGYLTPSVMQLVKDSGFPGMKVLEFAFDSREPSNYLPHTYTPNCVCYVGTHDNETAMQWWKKISRADSAYARRYLGLNSREGINWGLIRGGMSSVAELFVGQLSDFLGLGAEARINEPGNPSGNWRWRLQPGQLTDELAAKIYEYTRMYGRLNPLSPAPAEPKGKPSKSKPEK
ncbi:MAG TPA: 4-alpha-glucanotransferase [Candidatus Scatomorpha gallistercoris]|nr:4-alpha-glucanotransferase [Candidatus Scatomorpha gallistercoris]